MLVLVQIIIYYITFVFMFHSPPPPGYLKLHINQLNYAHNPRSAIVPNPFISFYIRSPTNNKDTSPNIRANKKEQLNEFPKRKYICISSSSLIHHQSGPDRRQICLRLSFSLSLVSWGENIYLHPMFGDCKCIEHTSQHWSKLDPHLDGLRVCPPVED